jgi:hypothetical protein
MPEINSNFTFTREQERLINMYISQYNQTNAHIEQLLDMLDEIRLSIFNIANTSRRNTNRYGHGDVRSSTYINSFINRLFNDRDQNYIRYDYNMPINPNLYTIFNESNSNSNINPRTNIRTTPSPTPTYNNTNNITNPLSNELTNFINTFLNTPVIIRPTPEQIQSSSRLIKFEDIQEPLSDRCPISLELFSREEIVRQLLPCGHIFCQSGFQEWFQNNVRCPVCRYDIRNYRSTATDININATNSNTETNTNATANTTINTNTTISTSDNPNNLNVVRNANTNEIEHITFDITNNAMSDNIIDGLTDRILESILFPQTQDNERFTFDASNNILLYETIIRPNLNRK